MHRAVLSMLALLAVAAILAASSGCAQPWRFSEVEGIERTTLGETAAARLTAESATQARFEGTLARTRPPACGESRCQSPREESIRLVDYQMPPASSWPQTSLAAQFASGETPAGPPLYTPLDTPFYVSPDASLHASLDAPLYTPTDGPTLDCGPAPPACALDTPPSDGARYRLALAAYWEETKWHVVNDYRNYYRWQTALDLGLAVALAAPLANTSLDHDFRNWYQDDVRSEGSDDLASFWRPWGEGKIFIPVWAGLAVVGHLLDDRPAISILGDFSDRTTRAYLVGAPPMLLMQFVLGASRPGETRHTSHWKPFDDTNAVSGHAFIGAVPFITAANMVENPWAKGAFYALSTFTAWSRVNDDRHYLSQVCLGWYMAYLAARAVDETAHVERQLRVVPIATPQMTGLGLVWQR